MQDFIFIKAEKFFYKLFFSDILYIQAEKKHVLISTPKDMYVSLVSISHLEKLLPKHLFCRVHRSYIISLPHIYKFDNEMVYMGDKKIPIAEQFLNELKQAITIVNCEIKSLKLDNGDVDKLLLDL